MPSPTCCRPTSPPTSASVRTSAPVLFHVARAELRRLAGDDRLVLLVDDLDLLDDTSVAVLVPLIMARTVFLVGHGAFGADAVGASSPCLAARRAPRADGDRAARRRRARHPAAPGPRRAGVRAPREPSWPACRAATCRCSPSWSRGAASAGVLAEANGVWDLVGPLPTTAALDELVAEHLAGVDPDGPGRARAAGRVRALRPGRPRAGPRARPRSRPSRRAALIVVVTSTAADRRAPRPPAVRRGAAGAGSRRCGCGACRPSWPTWWRRTAPAGARTSCRSPSGGSARVARSPGERLLGAARLALAARDSALAIRLRERGREPATSRPSNGPTCSSRRTRCRADLAEVERAGRRGLGARTWATPGAPTWPSGWPRPASSGIVTSTAPWPPTRRPGPRLTEPDAVAAVDVRRASLLAGAGRPAEALQITEAMGPVTSPRTRVELAGALAVGAAQRRSLRRGPGASREQAAAEHDQLPGWMARRGIAQHVINEAHALAYAGRYARRASVLEPAVERARADEAMGAWVWFEMALAEVARDTGRGHEAIQRFREVAEAAPKAGQHAALVWAHVGVAQGHLLLGECVEAAAALGRGRPGGRQPGGHVGRDAGADPGLADARAGATWRRPAAHPRRRSSRSARTRCSSSRLALLHDLVRLGVPPRGRRAPRGAGGCVDGPIGRHRTRSTPGPWSTATSPRSAPWSDRFEAIDSLVPGGRGRRRAGRPPPGRGPSPAWPRAAQHVGGAGRRAGGLHTPVLARGAGIEPLTAREREVALLAVGGRSSRAIGDHLGLSTRTVDTHLAHVYRKLGIAGRSELAVALDVSSRGLRSRRRRRAFVTRTQWLPM